MYFLIGAKAFSANFPFMFQKGFPTPSISKTCHSPQRRDDILRAISAVRAVTGACPHGCGRDDGAAAPQDGRRPRTATRAADEELPVGAPATDRRAAGQASAEDGRARVRRRGRRTALGCRAA